MAASLHHVPVMNSAATPMGGSEALPVRVSTSYCTRYSPGGLLPDRKKWA